MTFLGVPVEIEGADDVEEYLARVNRRDELGPDDLITLAKDAKKFEDLLLCGIRAARDLQRRQLPLGKLVITYHAIVAHPLPEFGHRLCSDPQRYR